MQGRGGNAGNGITFPKGVAEDSCSRTMFDAQKGIGIGRSTTGLRQERIDAILSTPWTTDGKTFSDRLRSNKDAPVSNARKTILQGMVSGSSLRDMTDRLSKAMGSSKYAAGRLIHTESTCFQAQASRQVYRELDCDRVECLATLDESTCDICGAMDGQIVPMPQYEPGVTVPPFHPNCRCTTIPWVDDADAERIARDHDGETYQVPGDMSYTEWAQNYLRYSLGDSKIIATAPTFNPNGKPYEISQSESHMKWIMAKGTHEKRAIFSEDVPGNNFPSLAAHIPQDGDKYDIAVHGADTYVQFFGRDIDAYTLAKVIMARKDYREGQEVRLLSCSTGSTRNTGNCFAQILANELKTTVYAPTDTLFVRGNPSGKTDFWVGDIADGDFKCFIWRE